MRNGILIYLAIFLLSCQPSAVYYPDAICIENVTVIDPIDGEQAGRTVIIEGDKIIQVSPTEDLSLDEKNTIIDGSGKYLMPGLWDAHVHFAYLEELAPSMFNLFLAYGITSVRDTGGKIDFVKKWKAAASANPTEAPRVMIAGPLLDGVPTVYDGSSPTNPPLGVGSQTPEDVVAKVKELDAQGVDLLKAYEMLSPDQFRAILAEAKARDLLVTGHVPLSMDVISAAEAGLNSMEHIRNLEMSMAGNWEELLEQRRQLLAAGRTDMGGILRSRIHAAQRKTAIEAIDPDQETRVLEALAEHQVWQTPTLTLIRAGLYLPFEREDWKQSMTYLPPAMEEQWLEGIASYTATGMNEDQKAYRNWCFAEISKIHEAGIPIMAGTDCPIFFLTPGLSLHEELWNLEQAGIPTAEVLKTGTINPARYFGMEEELGRVQEGYWADLLLLDANPLEEIRNTQRINAVIKQGKLYDRAALDEILERLDRGQ
ncbi:MAG TPA: amidohydrolase family protein [Saprospiraceae bacterium]|nr:amidohydrolase family protein [Saprospiraceae bacterium]